jgi:hypothetical protein
MDEGGYWIREWQGSESREAKCTLLEGANHSVSGQIHRLVKYLHCMRGLTTSTAQYCLTEQQPQTVNRTSNP